MSRPALYLSDRDAMRLYLLALPLLVFAAFPFAALYLLQGTPAVADTLARGIRPAPDAAAEILPWFNVGYFAAGILGGLGQVAWLTFYAPRRPSKMHGPLALGTAVLFGGALGNFGPWLGGLIFSQAAADVNGAGFLALIAGFLGLPLVNVLGRRALRIASGTERVTTPRGGDDA